MTFASVKVEVPREPRWKRPLIIPRGGGKPTSYTRVTTMASTLEDQYNLSLWSQRMVMLGLAERPDLLLSVAAHRDDKAELNKIAAAAAEAAKSHAAATIGTAIHALCEQIDAGVDVGQVPGEYRRDLDAYVTATKRLRVLASERFIVDDQLKVGGTPDRVVEYDGENYIADIKTGSIEYGALSIACQLAMYAHGQFYDPRDGTRTPLPAVNGQRAIVIHVPAGTGTARLAWVDIAAGWEAVQLALLVRDWRKRSGLITPLDSDAAIGNLVDAGLIFDAITAQIVAATSTAQLVELWQKYESEWLPQHTAAAAARKSLLTGGTS